MHSSPALLTPDSDPPPEHPGTHPEPPKKEDRPRPHTVRRWIIITSAVLAVAVIAFLDLRSKGPANGSRLPSVTIHPDQIVRLKGTTEAVQSRGILAPLLAGQQVSTLTIIHRAPSGAKVKAGDLLVEFDRQAQMRDFVDRKADYEKLVDQVAEEQAKENAARAKDETELRQAEDNLRKAELEMQKAEIVSRIDAEKNQENLDEAKATYDQLRETFDLKRKAAQASIRILEIQRDRTQQTMLHAQANSNLMQVRSPLDGVAVRDTVWKQGTMGEVQEGDQIRPGVPVMEVVNPTAMQVRVLANQEDFPRLQIGQTAKVRLDAYPEMVFTARLAQLAPIAEGGDFSSKLRSFVVIVSIEGSDPKLMPDLSAAVDVDVSQQSAGSSPSPGSGSGS